VLVVSSSAAPTPCHWDSPGDASQTLLYSGAGQPQTTVRAVDENSPLPNLPISTTSIRGSKHLAMALVRPPPTALAEWENGFPQALEPGSGTRGTQRVMICPRHPIALPTTILPNRQELSSSD